MTRKKVLHQVFFINLNNILCFSSLLSDDWSKNDDEVGWIQNTTNNHNF